MGNSRLFLTMLLILTIFHLTLFSWGVSLVLGERAASETAISSHDLAVSELRAESKVIEVSSGGVHILTYRSELTAKVKVANKGKESEGPVVVGLTLVDEGFKKVVFEKARSLSDLSPGQEKTVLFRGIPGNQGSINRLQAFAYPVPEESSLDDNTRTLRYIMKPSSH